jgi:hypothetical protein
LKTLTAPLLSSQLQKGLRWFCPFWPNAPNGLAQVVQWLKNHTSHRYAERSKLLLETCLEELKRLGVRLDTFSKSDTESIADLMSDGIEKASKTRSEERIKRVGTILAHGIAAFKPSEADEVEEMMRIATELTDRDVAHLARLVEMEGGVVASAGRIERYEAHRRWEDSDFGRRRDPEVESIFSKLESYGLVWRLPSPTNMNVMADIQSGYALLPKGLRFTELAKSKV